jgi:hypothetical protein
MVYKEARPAGQTSDPSVSVPTLSGAYPAATTTADPEEDPEGLYKENQLDFDLMSRRVSRYGHLLSRLQVLRLERTAIDTGHPEQTSHWAGALPYSIISE